MTALKSHAPEYRKLLIWLAVLVLCFNAGCAAIQTAPSYTDPIPGDVLALRMSTVLRELRWTFMGSLRNIVMWNQSNDNLLIAFPYLNGWGWVCVNGQATSICNALREIGGKGNFARPSDFASLELAAEKVGYRTITGADLVKLFPALAKSVMDASAAFSQSVMPTLFVVPAGVVGEDPWATIQQ
jgi:hypothetical protein